MSADAKLTRRDFAGGLALLALGTRQAMAQGFAGLGSEAGGSAIVDEALGLAERLAEAADQGKVDLNDLGRRARRLLEKTSKPAGDEKLF